MAQQGPTQGPSFDLAKVSAADKLILGGAGAYFIWTLLPFWYKFEIPAVGSDSINGFRGFTLLAALLGLVAIAEVVAARVMGVELKIPAKRGLIHVALAAVALVCTLLGFVVRPGAFTVTYGLSWGIFVGLVLAGVWAYGAYMLFSQPDMAPPAPPAPPAS